MRETRLVLRVINGLMLLKLLVLEISKTSTHRFRSASIATYVSYLLKLVLLSILRHRVEYGYGAHRGLVKAH